MSEDGSGAGAGAGAGLPNATDACSGKGDPSMARDE